MVCFELTGPIKKSLGSPACVKDKNRNPLRMLSPGEGRSHRGQAEVWERNVSQRGEPTHVVEPLKGIKKEKKTRPLGGSKLPVRKKKGEKAQAN